MGMIVTQWQPTFRRRAEGLRGVQWRWVTADRSKLGEPDVVLVNCPDAYRANATSGSKVRAGFQFSCLCKTAKWFRRALVLFPGAAFIGKLEDDSVMHDARALAELVGAYRTERRARGTRQPLLWYGSRTCPIRADLWS